MFENACNNDYNKTYNDLLDACNSCNNACNTCMESIFRIGRVECLVNPSLGREKELEIHPAEKPKKIMVIGGGPGGLNVAWVAAKRGHHVSLYERQASLGGQLNLSTVNPYKKELFSLINYQKTQIEKYGVDCHLKTEVTIEVLKDVKPDVVILATGSRPITPSIPGMDKPHVFTFPEILNGKQRLIKGKCIVIGGGATGCEIAHYISEQGYQVTLVEQLPRVAENLETVTRKVLLNKMRDSGVRILTGHKISKITDEGVFLTAGSSEEIFLEASSVVISIGTKPDDSLYGPVQALGIEYYRIGDCLESRSAKAAIYEGAVIGRAV